jgi:hypothetical protein
MKRKKAIMFLNAMLAEKVKEQERLCKQWPQYARERKWPAGSTTMGGLLDDLVVLKYALHPSEDPDDKHTLIDELDMPQTFVSVETGSNPVNFNATVIPSLSLDSSI